MFTLRNLVKASLVFAVCFSPVLGGYNESDRFAYSFYFPASYEIKKVKNPYGPFFQYSHKAGAMFVHFWARRRPRGADLEFLRDAYEQDFMNSFLGDKAPDPKLIEKKGRTTILYEYNARVLERNYVGRAYYFTRSKFFYAMVFYYQPELRDEIKDDMELMIYSLQYGK